MCLAETQEQARKCADCLMKKREGLRQALIGHCWYGGTWRWANWEHGVLYDWFTEHIWLSLLVISYKQGQKIREAGSLWPSPNQFGFTTSVALLWTPELVSYCRNYGFVSWAGCCKDCQFYFNKWWINCPFVCCFSEPRLKPRFYNPRLATFLNKISCKLCPS